MVAANTADETGRTYYSQSSGPETRIDYLCVPSAVLSSSRLSRTFILENLGDTVQYIISRFRVDHFPLGVRMNIILEHIAHENPKHIPVLGIDANGHVGLNRDPCTRIWCPTVSSAIFGKEPERENPMVKICREWSEASGMVSANTADETGRKYYPQSFWD